jgi:hypothetical protein
MAKRDVNDEVLKEIIDDMFDAQAEELGEHKSEGDQGGDESLEQWAKEESDEPEHKAEGGEVKCGHYAHGGDMEVHAPTCMDHPHAIPGGMHRAHGGMAEHKASECEDGKAYAEGGEVKLGTGERFEHLVHRLAGKGAKNPGALAGYIGREKYGAKKMGKFSAGGK